MLGIEIALGVQFLEILILGSLTLKSLWNTHVESRGKQSGRRQRLVSVFRWAMELWE